MYDKTQLMWHKVKKQLGGNNVCELVNSDKLKVNKICLIKNGNSHKIALIL